VSVGTPGNSTVRRSYDGTPKTASITTEPSGLSATYTYNGSTDAPTLPGTYDVVATIDDHNYSGTATGKLVITITALVRHAPDINGELDGSFQMLTGENVVLNGSSLVSGDLLVPGTPQLRLNGRPTLVGTVDEQGDAAPSNYGVTLNGSAMARYLVRRVNPIAMPVLTAPQAPAGTRNVVLNRTTDVIGDPATIRNLTLNGRVGMVALPPGAYGVVTVNGGSGLVLGVAEATEPAVYDLQQLRLNGSAAVTIVGPVVLRLADDLVLNAGAVGTPGIPLVIECYRGGVTLNGRTRLDAEVLAPAGSVIINGSSELHGRVTADRLTIHGVLSEAP
jgi:rhamnogalacturonan endolyase